MKTITIRGIDDELEKAIKETSKKKQESMNQTVVKLLRDSVGLSKKAVFPKYNDLDELAGTWSAEEETLFFKNIRAFEEVDKGMWE
ncbi:antitoxin [bacterium]|nr:antitoxin [candidate division CSSED10-310 bacterium]